MKELIKDLKRMIRKSKTKLKKVNCEISMEENSAFVYPKNESFLNPKYISFEHYFQILALEEFLKSNSNLTNDEIYELLQEDKAFDFLLELNNNIKDMLDMLRVHGAKSVAIMYVSDKLYPKNADNCI